MTEPYSDTQPRRSPAQPRLESARPRLSGFAIAALVLGAIIAILHMTIRVLDPYLATIHGFDGTPVPLILGILGLASIVPIAGTVALGHLALVRTRPGRGRGRALAWIGTVIGYSLAVLYFNRIIVAVIATVADKDGQFVQDFFWWS